MVLHSDENSSPQSCLHLFIIQTFIQYVLLQWRHSVRHRWVKTSLVSQGAHNLMVETDTWSDNYKHGMEKYSDRDMQQTGT